MFALFLFLVLSFFVLCMHDDRCLEFCAALYSTVKFYTVQCCTWGGGGANFEPLSHPPNDNLQRVLESRRQGLR